MTKDIKNTEHKISLLPHNQKLFGEIMEEINNGEHSIFYSEATGLGKSFIFMRLVYDLFTNEDVKVLYIVPKTAIWENMQFYKEFEYIKDHVEMTTFADFNSTKIKHYHYDAIFIDECHHLASDIQGNNILKLCKEYVEDGRYVFGFTATPIIKSGRKVINTDIYFNSKIYGINITEAIESGLFKKIQYAIADPKIIVDDKEYCKKYSIDGTKTLLENIISEHKDIDRWLVYFTNISSLNKNLQSVKKLFPDYKIFIMHSNRNDNDEQLKEFNEYKGKSMLLTVSMVLEGIHPKKVGGILLYRNVTKYNTLLQIIGRVCNMDNKISPLCVDITNSIYNIKAPYIDGCIMSNDIDNKYNNNCKRKKQKSIKSIIDIEASSYRYIDLIANLCGYTKEYRGIAWKNDSDLSKKLGKCNSYVHIKIKQGYTYEQIIDQILDITSKKYSYRGYEWDTDVELSRLIGKRRKYVCDRKHAGCMYKQIIDEVLDGPRKKYSYRGYEWDTDVELSSKLGKYRSHVHIKIRHGYTYEQIIDEVLASKKYSYRGYEWCTDRELSRNIGKSDSYVHVKMIQGYTREQIIDEVLDGSRKKYSYRGYEWDTDRELSRNIGKCNSYVHAKIRRGYTHEQIIDEVLDGKK